MFAGKKSIFFLLHPSSVFFCIRGYNWTIRRNTEKRRANPKKYRRIQRKAGIYRGTQRKMQENTEQCRENQGMEPLPELMDRVQAAELLGIKASAFDRFASEEFGPVRVKRGKAFFYPTKELLEYRAYRNQCDEAETPRLTWNELASQNAVLSEQVRVLRWVLMPCFSGSTEVHNSAAEIEKRSSDHYERAKRVLAELGFGLDDLRERMRNFPPVNNSTSSTSLEQTPPDLSNPDSDHWLF